MLMISSDLPGDPRHERPHRRHARRHASTAMLPGKTDAHDVMAAALGQAEGRRRRSMSALLSRTLRRRRARVCCCSRSRVFAPHFFRARSRCSRGSTAQMPALVAASRHDARHHLPADRHLDRLAVRRVRVIAGLLAAAQAAARRRRAGGARRGRVRWARSTACSSRGSACPRSSSRSRRW